MSTLVKLGLTILVLVISAGLLAGLGNSSGNEGSGLPGGGIILIIIVVVALGAIWKRRGEE